MKINKNDFLILVKVVKEGFRKYKILYFLSIISITSILLETFAMSLLSSLSGRRFLLFNNFFQTLNPVLTFCFALFVFVIRFTSMYYIESKYVYISRLYQHHLSVRTLRKIFSEKLNIIEKKEIGYFISMAGDEASKCAEILNSFLRVVNTIVIGGIYFAMIIYYDLNFIYVLIIFFILNFFVISKIVKRIFILGNDSIVFGRNASSIFLDALNSLRTIKSFGMANFIHDTYSEKMSKYQMTNFRITSLSIFNKIFPLISLFILLDIYCFVDYLNKGNLNIGYLLALFFMLLRLLTLMGDLFQTSSVVVSNIKLTNDIIAFSETINEIRDGFSVPEVNKISLKNISFGYKNDQLLFNNLNITFKKGFCYAIIGKTGSGKSSLIDLIMNFNTPLSGVVEINDLPSNLFNEVDLINKILYVGQESIIFNNTVHYNLVLDRDYGIEKLNKMLKLAEIYETVNSFDEGFNHILNYRGTNISGGQKQRLNLVRALLREPDVLILDESVNALDSATRMSIVNNILNEYEDKIVILITHDKDILDLVNHVIDLDQIILF